VVEERSSQSQDAFGVQAAGHSEEGEGQGRGAGAAGEAGGREGRRSAAPNRKTPLAFRQLGTPRRRGEGEERGTQAAWAARGGRGGAGSEEGAQLPTGRRLWRSRGPPDRYVAEPASGTGPSQPRTSSRSSSRGADG
jgi:hypothetical protein